MHLGVTTLRPLSEPPTAFGGRSGRVLGCRLVPGVGPARRPSWSGTGGTDYRPLDGLAQVVPQVPAVSDLDCLGAPRVRRRSRPWPGPGRSHRYRAVLPARRRSNPPIVRQDVDGSARLDIDQQPPTAPSPAKANSSTPNRRRAVSMAGQAATISRIDVIRLTAHANLPGKRARPGPPAPARPPAARCQPGSAAGVAAGQPTDLRGEYVVFLQPGSRQKNRRAVRQISIWCPVRRRVLAWTRKDLPADTVKDLLYSTPPGEIAAQQQHQDHTARIVTEAAVRDHPPRRTTTSPNLCQIQYSLAANSFRVVCEV